MECTRDRWRSAAPGAVYRVPARTLLTPRRHGSLHRSFLDWVAIQLGIDAFRRERDDHAFEYILAAPLSRSKLLFQKLAPRVFVPGVLALCVIGLTVALEIGDVTPLLEQDMPRFLRASLFFPYACILFAAGFSLSLIDWGNGRLAATAAIPPTWFILKWLSDALLGPAVLAARRRFDLLAPSRYTRRSGLVVLLPLAVLAVVSGVVFAFS